MEEETTTENPQDKTVKGTVIEEGGTSNDNGDEKKQNNTHGFGTKQDIELTNELKKLKKNELVNLAVIQSNRIIDLETDIMNLATKLEYIKGNLNRTVLQLLKCWLQTK